MSVQCFQYSWKARAMVLDTYYSPCGNLNTTTPSLSCCGYNDICVTNGFCFHTYSATGETGYYVPGCTSDDPNNPACPPRCRDQARPDVVWNATSSLWQCCGINDQGSPECDSPTNQTFTAPGPASLIQYFSISANFKATSTSIASSASTRGSSSTTAAGAAHTTSDIVGAASAASQPRPSSGQSSSLSSAPAPSSSNVSPGVIVGIAIGCALAGLVLMLLAGLIFFRWYAARWKREQIAELGCNVSKHIEELPADEPLSRAATVRDVRPLRRSILEIGNASTANLQRFEVAERGSGFWPFARTHGGDHQNV